MAHFHFKILWGGEFMIIEDVNNTFSDIFQKDATNYYFAPGRVNLIGEHTDYNGGHVFPAAITLGTYAAVCLREDTIVNVYSSNLSENGIISFDIDDNEYNNVHNFANYIKGVITFIRETGLVIDKGFDIAISGNIPNRAGLSSSASLELLVGIVLNDIFDLDLKRIDLVKIGKKVENEFIGVQSGIMDQFVIGMGKEKQAIFLDTNSLKYEMVPIDLLEYAIVIMNTNKQRELETSKYNERRNECEKGLAFLQTKLQITSLGEVSLEDLEESCSLVEDDIIYKRIRHAVSENIRTIEAVQALREIDFVKFGQLINESHISLRDDYEVTGIELDTLVETAWEQSGVLGARMTGAGFGGCAIAFVKKNQINSFIKKVGEVYSQKIGYDASFYIAEIGDGAKVINFN